jgi:hypothetical protein
MSNLPDDICRCRDDNCPQSRQCARWIQRDLGGSRIVSEHTLFPYDLALVGGRCPSFIADASAIEDAR